MRIAVMGSGGLGGYFGARLAAGGADVHFIARGRHLEAMRSDGLRVEGPEPHAHRRRSARPTIRRGRRRRSRDVLRQALGHRGGAAADPPDGRARARDHLVPERRAEGPVPARRLRRGADHGRRRLRRHDHRPARRHPPDRADAAAAVRRVRRLPFAARAGAARRRVSPAASRPNSPTTSCARSGRSTCSWSACRERRRRCARRSARSARIRRRAPSCST